MYGDGGFFFLKPVGAGAVEPVREYGFHMAPHGLAGYGAATSGTRTLDRDDPATAGVRYRYDDSPLTYPELARFYRRAKFLHTKGYFTDSEMTQFKNLYQNAKLTANYKETSAASEYLDSRNTDAAFRDYIDQLVRRGEVRALGYRFSRLPQGIKKGEIGTTWITKYVGPRVEAEKARSASSSASSAPGVIEGTAMGVSPRFLPSVSSVSPSGGAGARAGTPTVGVRTGGLSATTPSTSNGLAQPRAGGATPGAGAGPMMGPPAGGIESQPQLSFTPGEVPFVGETPGDTKEVITDETPATVAEETFLSKYGLLIAGGVLVTGAVAYYYRDSLGFGATEQK